MIFLLSPAKRLDFSPHGLKITATKPKLSGETALLAETAKKLTRPKIKKLMNLSDDLADLNYQRFQSFDPERKAKAPAAVTFAGDVYRGLDARSLSEDDLKWAQDHVRILSGLYGLLRPLDGIQPYRLEMGTKLKNKRGKDLYAFWGPEIAEEVDKAAKDGVIVNLASNEYFKSVDRKALKARVITPVFKEITDKGEARVMAFYAKYARGLMARWAVENRIEDSAALTNFREEGYAYDKSLSSDDEWVFTRPKPAPKKG